MATLVTGGNGWVPSHIVRRLARRGETVVSYDLMPPDDALREMLGPLAGQVLFAEGDVTDRERLRRAAERHGVTAIVHAAVITPRTDRERREPERIIGVNYGGTVNALEVARGLPNLRRFVYVSSGAVFGEQPPGATTVDEESPANATTLYGITKLASERTALRYGDLFGMDVVALRPSNVYGPMERFTPGYVGATQLREMLRIHFDEHQPIKVASLQGPHLDWTYVEDIAEGVERAWAHEEPPPHRVYCLTSGRLYSVGEVLDAFRRNVPGLEYRVVPPAEANFPGTADEPPGPLPSSARMLADFGWAPSTPFDVGMEQYLAWIMAHGPQ